MTTGKSNCNIQVERGVLNNSSFKLPQSLVKIAEMALSRLCWLQVPKTSRGKRQSAPVNKDRFISKMFLRGDSVILVLRNPK